MAQIIKTGDFQIDVGTRTVRVRDRELNLSSEEFDLLVFLVGHPSSIINPAHHAEHQVRRKSRAASRGISRSSEPTKQD